MAPRRPPCWPRPLVQEGLRNVAAGANPVGCDAGMEAATAEIVTGIARLSEAVAGEAIRQVATVSAGWRRADRPDGF